MVDAFSLNQNGDLNISKNGVIRVITGADSDIQSAVMLIANKKGSYAFLQDLGLDENLIFNYNIKGVKQEVAIAEITEQLIKFELSKDPNVLGITNFDYKRIDNTRRLKISFTLNMKDQSVLQSITVG